ncbi:MAG: hypothetical protein AB1762_14870 [Gemmatimonadota bacterium]
MVAILAGLLLQTNVVVLENEYVRVTRDAAPCAAAAAPQCGDRVIVALGNVRLNRAGALVSLRRGEIAVFTAGQAHGIPSGERYFEVAIKPDHPSPKRPAEHIPPDKNAVLYDSDRLFIFEERLAVGDTRERHSHRQRVVIQLNRTKLQQWPDGESEVIRDIVPDTAAFNAPVIHRVKNVGELPLRGIVIELKK